MSMALEQVRFERVDQGKGVASGAQQLWDLRAPQGHVFARAEVFEGSEQWGVRLDDRAPDLEDPDLVRLVGRLLVWDVGCKADTVELVLVRNHERHMLVRVGGEYV